MKTLTLTVESMTCNHCKASVESALKAVVGVSDADANLSTKAVTVNCDDNVSLQRLKEAVEEVGFDVSD